MTENGVKKKKKKLNWIETNPPDHSQLQIEITTSTSDQKKKLNWIVVYILKQSQN